MTGKFAALPAVCLVAAFLASPVFAQGAPQTVDRSQVLDVSHIATGYRASKITGSEVYNGGNDKIGTVDDLIVNPDDRVPYAILSVGGFLGLGAHLVAVPYGSLQFADGKILLPGATKDQLRTMPEFKYRS